MPKPVFQDNGSGMHTHNSLWKHGGYPLFYDGAVRRASTWPSWYIGGLLRHAPAIGVRGPDDQQLQAPGAGL